MTKFFPISVPVEIKSVQSDMTSLNWTPTTVIAEFLIPGNELEKLRVTFPNTQIIRVLDEMLLSTEGDTRWEGLIPNHLAYRVEESLFWKTQSWALTNSDKSLLHYRFITGGTCLDVLANAAPIFTLERTGP